MFWKEFFYFQKSDRKVLVVALLVAALALGLIFYVGEKNSHTDVDVSDSTADVVQQPSGDRGKSDNKGYYAVEEQTHTLFSFDPNTADSTQLLALGLQPWQVRNIYRYRAKGGVFREKTDFARVYGLTVKQYKELEPYIQISSDYRPAAEVYGKQRHYDRNYSGNYESGPALGGNQRQYEEFPRDTMRFPYKLKPGETIDANLSDTTQLKKVPGIGSGYARAIVRYRERLGGFSNPDQLLEIEGFPTEAVSYFTFSSKNIRKINVNKAGMADLRRHPYINFYQAKAILDYRRLKGNLTSLDELRLLPEFPPQLLDRLVPYVEF